MMPVVYLAGPFRGEDHWAIWTNINNAAALALRVWHAGAACLCPHMNTFCFQGAAPDHTWLDGDLEMLRRCDAVLMTPDWERSIGASAERTEAIRRGLPVFYDIDTLRSWLVRVRIQPNSSGVTEPNDAPVA